MKQSAHKLWSRDAFSHQVSHKCLLNREVWSVQEMHKHDNNLQCHEGSDQMWKCNLGQHQPQWLLWTPTVCMAAVITYSLIRAWMMHIYSTSPCVDFVRRLDDTKWFYLFKRFSFNERDLTFASLFEAVNVSNLCNCWTKR